MGLREREVDGRTIAIMLAAWSFAGFVSPGEPRLAWLTTDEGAFAATETVSVHALDCPEEIGGARRADKTAFALKY